MMRSFENHVGDVADVGFGIVGPDGYEAMLQNSRDFAELGIPFIFDPGQAMPLFNGKELSHDDRAGDLRHGQRLRVEPAAGAHRLEREADRRARRRAT